jgi:hypothetical protein
MKGRFTIYVTIRFLGEILVDFYRFIRRHSIQSYQEQVPPMAMENPSRFSLSAFRTQIIILLQSVFDAGVLFVQQNARVILAILLAAFVIVSLFSCFVITGLGMGVFDAGGATPQPGIITANDATATFGAEQFHLQLTAGASGP